MQALKRRLMEVEASNSDLALPQDAKPIPPGGMPSVDNFAPPLPQDVVNHGAPQMNLAPPPPQMTAANPAFIPRPGPNSPDTGNQMGLGNPNKQLLKQLLEKRMRTEMPEDTYPAMVK